jgi:DNA-binding transcriptional ArsR family regulator
MPNLASDIIAPKASPGVVSLEPVINILHSLWLLMDAENKTGLDDWVTRTAAALTPEERETNDLILDGFYYVVLPEQSWPSFPEYLDYLAACDPVARRDKMLKIYAQFLPPSHNEKRQEIVTEPGPVDWTAILESVDTYLGFLQEHFGTDHINRDIEARAYSYIVDPPAMQEMIVSHLRNMWEKFLAPEWERVRPMLQDSVTAFQQIDFSDMSRLEAAQLVTGRTVEGERWGPTLEEIERVVFVPTAHIGPYLGTFRGKDTLWVFFGARIPEGVQFYAPDLSRAEIVVRLNALADDTRLRILRLVSEEGELRSQDIMQSLNLSQSAASRHLKQLSATGYLIERRCNGAKCYKLNSQRVDDTLQAVSAFLRSN